MNDEATFIKAVQTAPGDAGMLLIYADWLEDHGDPRAEFLRLRVALGQASSNVILARDYMKRLRDLRSSLDPAWLAALDCVPLENCPLQFAYPCPKRWEDLRITESATIRYCEACQKDVHYCSTLKQARRRAEAGDCVAVDSLLSRRPHDLEQAPAVNSRRIRVGVVAAPPKSHAHEEDLDNSTGLRQRSRDGRRGANRRRHLD